MRRDCGELGANRAIRLVPGYGLEDLKEGGETPDLETCAAAMNRG